MIDTPGKVQQTTAVKVCNNENKMEKSKVPQPKENKYSLPQEINILKDSDINLKQPQTTTKTSKPTTIK